ncbi:MAG: O-antigen ligase family protein [Marinilabiliaceae bacterium]|nr:O-antigen ligase family protein [Marinilabiliaceae bacterium]
MIKTLLSDKYSLAYLIFHVILGAISTIIKWPLIIWFYFFLGTSILTTIKHGNVVWLICILAYIPGIELIARMTNAYPFIPWEIGKYFPVVIFMILCLIEKIRVERLLFGGLIILFTIPAVILGNSNFERISFALFGIINTGILCVIFFGRVLFIDDFKRILKSLISPIVMILTYVIVKSPDLSDASFGLASTAEMTGGFGANQVSTIFGVGFVVMLVAYLLGFNIFGRKWLSLFVAGLLLSRGLLSFSRGGVVVAVLAISAMIVVISGYKLPRKAVPGIKRIKLSHLFVGILLLGVIFYVSNEISGGNLALRYMGETNSSLAGGKRSLNSLTTGRLEIVMADIQMWLDHPFWGIGGGNSDLFRRGYGVNNMSHSEFSRLLAEQGVFGILIILMLLYPLLYKLKFDRLNYAFFIGFWILAIGSSFHSAMRTMLTPFFFALSLIYILPIRRPKQKKVS